MSTSESDRVHKRALTYIGGDAGAAILLGSVAYFVLFWQGAAVINDSQAVADALANLMDGSLSIQEIRYGGPRVPGMNVHKGTLYAENYGQLFVTLPVALLIEASLGVLDQQLAILGAWCMLVVGIGYYGGGALDRRQVGTRVGLLVAVLLYVTNLVLFAPRYDRPVHYLSLQVATMVVAALVGVVLFRLVSEMYDRRTGAAAAVATVLASPVAVFATLPMRHVWTALFALLTVFWFYRARTVEHSGRALRYRALSYVPVGLTTWVFAPEGFLLLLAVAPLDLLTARSNGPRELAVLGLTVFVSLLPFFATNFAINGNPLRPPILMPAPVQTTAEQGGTGGGIRTSFENGLVSGIVLVGITLVETFLQALLTPVTDPGDFYHTVVRGAGGRLEIVGSGTAPTTVQAARAARNLALLESLPLAAATAGGLGALASVKSRRDSLRRWVSRPEGQVDLLVVAYLGTLALFYLPRLPIRAQITVRYLLPGMPLLVYLVFRLPSVRRAIQDRPRTLLWTYGGVVLIGSQLVVVALASPTVGTSAADSAGEYLGTAGLISLGTAVLVAVWAVVDEYDRVDRSRLGAAVLGLCAGMTTVLVLLLGLQFTNSGALWLPIAQRISEVLQFGFVLV